MQELAAAAEGLKCSARGAKLLTRCALNLLPLTLPSACHQPEQEYGARQLCQHLQLC